MVGETVDNAANSAPLAGAANRADGSRIDIGARVKVGMVSRRYVGRILVLRGIPRARKPSPPASMRTSRRRVREHTRTLCAHHLQPPAPRGCSIISSRPRGAGGLFCVRTARARRALHAHEPTKPRSLRLGAAARARMRRRRAASARRAARPLAASRSASGWPRRTTRINCIL